MEADLEANEGIDLTIGALRCTRRLTQTVDLALIFCDAGGVASLANLICSSIDQPLIMLEAARCLICLLYFSSPAEEDVANWEQQISEARDAGTSMEELDIAASWYTIGMDSAMIEAICQAMCACAAVEGHIRQLRLQRVLLGLCTYFVAAHTGNDSLIGFGLENVMINALNAFAGEYSILQ
ncbi:hypothetical protein IE077_001364, partial [Cardiosporidium cionae]